MLLLVPAIGVGLALFEPWRLFTSSRVDEPVPVAADAPATPSAPEPIVLTRGEFVTQEHATSGTAQVLRWPDGQRVLRIENLASSDGPDLHVWLSDAAAGGDWYSYDDGRYVALGELKATHGSHNYPIPESADISGLNSVVIWCDRFNVAFGSAPLDL